MWPDAPISTASPCERVTTKLHIWILRSVARVLLSGASATAFCFAPIPVGWSRVDAADLVAPVRWWRSEAARGIADLEAQLRG